MLYRYTLLWLPGISCCSLNGIYNYVAIVVANALFVKHNSIFYYLTMLYCTEKLAYWCTIKINLITITGKIAVAMPILYSYNSLMYTLHSYLRTYLFSYVL